KLDKAPRKNGEIKARPGRKGEESELESEVEGEIDETAMTAEDGEAPAEEDTEESAGAAEPEGPAHNRAEVKALLDRGREKGFLTLDEVNGARPTDIVSSEQIEDVMSMFGENDIELVDDATKVKLPETKPPEPDAPNQPAEKEEEERDEDYDAGYSKGNDPV